MANEASYTVEQVALAARELRQAAGTEEAHFSMPQGLSSMPQAIELLSNEIRMLRERGFSDAKIADLLTGFDIAVTAEDVTRHSAKPRFQE